MFFFRIVQWHIGGWFQWPWFEFLTILCWIVQNNTSIYLPVLFNIPLLLEAAGWCLHSIWLDTDGYHFRVDACMLPLMSMMLTFSPLLCLSSVSGATTLGQNACASLELGGKALILWWVRTTLYHPNQEKKTCIALHCGSSLLWLNDCLVLNCFWHTVSCCNIILMLGSWWCKPTYALCLYSLFREAMWAHSEIMFIVFCMARPRFVASVLVLGWCY